MIRRTVLVFAALDLALAALILAIESGLLFVFAIGVDEVWQGSLGLNRYFGRVPRPEMIGDTRIVVAQSLGFFALYLPAMATLTAGGIGLILRSLGVTTRTWPGQYSWLLPALGSSTRSPRWRSHYAPSSRSTASGSIRRSQSKILSGTCNVWLIVGADAERGTMRE